MKPLIILLAVAAATIGIYFNQRHRDLTMASVSIKWVGEDSIAVGDSLLACALGTSQSGKTYILEPALILKMGSDSMLYINQAKGALTRCKNSLLVAGYVINTRRSPPVEWAVRNGSKISKKDLRRLRGSRS